MKTQENRAFPQNITESSFTLLSKGINRSLKSQHTHTRTRRALECCSERGEARHFDVDVSNVDVARNLGQVHVLHGRDGASGRRRQSALSKENSVETPSKSPRLQKRRALYGQYQCDSHHPTKRIHQQLHHQRADGLLEV